MGPAELGICSLYNDLSVIKIWCYKMVSTIPDCFFLNCSRIIKFKRIIVPSTSWTLFNFTAKAVSKANEYYSPSPLSLCFSWTHFLVIISSSCHRFWILQGGPKRWHDDEIITKKWVGGSNKRVAMGNFHFVIAANRITVLWWIFNCLSDCFLPQPIYINNCNNSKK